MSSRRSFIKKSAAFISMPLFSSKTEVFSILNKSASNQLNIGVIGTGDRGQGLIRILNRIEGMELVAVCDSLPFRLDQAASIAPKAKRYFDYKNLLSQKNLDAIIITTPLNTHASIAIDLSLIHI